MNNIAKIENGVMYASKYSTFGVNPIPDVGTGGTLVLDINSFDVHLFDNELTSDIDITFINPRISTTTIIIKLDPTTVRNVTFNTPAYHINTTGPTTKTYVLPNKVGRVMFQIFYDGIDYYVSENPFYSVV